MLWSINSCQKRVSANQYDRTTGSGFSLLRSCVINGFPLTSYKHFLLIAGSSSFFFSATIVSCLLSLSSRIQILISAILVNCQLVLCLPSVVISNSPGSFPLFFPHSNISLFIIVLPRLHVTDKWNILFRKFNTKITDHVVILLHQQSSRPGWRMKLWETACTACEFESCARIKKEKFG